MSAHFVIHIGPWSQLREGAREVRTAVFLQEQAIPVEMEWDEDDATALHAVARDGQGQAVGTGRLLVAQEGVARLGRMAVLSTHRGQGVGAAILQQLLASAQARGDRAVLLHAQRHAQAFYARAGFSEQGAPFDEAGIEHIEMVKSLVPSLSKP